MLSIYLVDDEPMAVRYTQMLIEASGYPCEIVGTQTNSTRAYMEIRTLKPDIVFTDISMPIMDGLELAEKVCKRGDTRVYLLTSYEDFEFAKRGVRIGVADYLLKNELSEKLLKELLENAEREIAASRRERQLILEQNVRDFLFGSSRVPEDHVYEERRMQRYALLTFYKPPKLWIDPDREPEEDLRLDSYALQRMDFPKGMDCTAFAQTRSREYCGVVFISETVVDSGRRLFQMADIILSRITQDDPGWKCICSDVCQRFFELQKEYRRQTECTAYLYRQRDQSVCFAHDIIYAPEEKLPVDDLLDEIARMLAGDDHEGTIRKAEAFFASCRKQDTQNAYIEHMRSLFQVLKGSTLRERSSGDYLAISPCYTDTVNLERALQNCIELFFEEKERAVLAQYSEHVLRAQQYVRKEYGRDISVSDIAQRVGVSEGHLRRLFKQEMNMSIVDYLTDYRIRQAKHLLRDHLVPNADIWKETGFSSAQYFSFVFKKKEGISPKEYQKRAGSEVR